MYLQRYRIIVLRVKDKALDIFLKRPVSINADLHVKIALAAADLSLKRDVHDMSESRRTTGAPTASARRLSAVTSGASEAMASAI